MTIESIDSLESLCNIKGNGKTLVLFNITKTLLDKSDKDRILRDINRDKLYKLIDEIKKERPDDAIKIIDFMFDYSSDILIDTCLFSVKKELENAGCIIFAMTSIRTGIPSIEQLDKTIEHIWYNKLNNEGITFDSSYDIVFENVNEFHLPDQKLSSMKPIYKQNDAMIYHGIIFCNNIKKDYMMSLVLQHINKDIDHIVMIDAESKNVHHMSAYIDTLNTNNEKQIIFTGYHFTKVLDHENTLPLIDDVYINEYKQQLYKEYDSVFGSSMDQ